MSLMSKGYPESRVCNQVCTVRRLRASQALGSGQEEVEVGIIAEHRPGRVGQRPITLATPNTAPNAP